MAYKKILTKHWDQIDPRSLISYRKKGGYEALQKALRMKPLEVIEEIKNSGLQGRGGAGFLTGMKWEIAFNQKVKERYFICNLDESEPGTYKDRLLAEKNPHGIIEGLIIGAYAVGANKAYVYINNNFKIAKFLLEEAVRQAREHHFIGKGVMGSSFNIEIEIFAGAGAYICGEESALINSIEGKRGEPRKRPPFACACGLESNPTVVNNAETLSNISWIIKNGATAFKGAGIDGNAGTKLFCVEGAVKNPGIYEAPMGIALHDVIFGLAGGMEYKKRFWFAQVGGASGGLVPIGFLDESPLYGREVKINLGSGAVLVVEKGQNVKKLLLSWINFFQRESCGQCVPCREGTFRLKEIVERLQFGDFNHNDKLDMENLIWVLSNTTFCPLGYFSVNALKDVIKYKLIKELRDLKV